MKTYAMFALSTLWVLLVAFLLWKISTSNMFSGFALIFPKWVPVPLAFALTGLLLATLFLGWTVPLYVGIRRALGGQ